mmetsp:Transcript_60183/g.140658  ORF Transcript_60183/g.140658 Transcript_60183/m.140658 type:complete len:218 (+) Transcript_60183:35-688(+)
MGPFWLRARWLQLQTVGSGLPHRRASFGKDLRSPCPLDEFESASVLEALRVQLCKSAQRLGAPQCHPARTRELLHAVHDYAQAVSLHHPVSNFVRLDDHPTHHATALLDDPLGLRIHAHGVENVLQSCCSPKYVSPVWHLCNVAERLTGFCLEPLVLGVAFHGSQHNLQSTSFQHDVWISRGSERHGEAERVLHLLIRRMLRCCTCRIGIGHHLPSI